MFVSQFVAFVCHPTHRMFVPNMVTVVMLDMVDMLDIEDRVDMADIGVMVDMVVAATITNAI